MGWGSWLKTKEQIGTFYLLSTSAFKPESFQELRWERLPMWHYHSSASRLGWLICSWGLQLCLWQCCCLFKDSATAPLICKAVCPAIRLFLCVLFFKESPQIYCNLTVNLLSFWLWVSSLAYPQIPLERVLRALLSSSVRGIVQIIVHRNQSALVADQAEGKGQGSKAQGAKRTGAGINHWGSGDEWVCASRLLSRQS